MSFCDWLILIRTFCSVKNQARTTFYFGVPEETIENKAKTNSWKLYHIIYCRMLVIPDYLCSHSIRW